MTNIPCHAVSGWQGTYLASLEMFVLHMYLCPPAPCPFCSLLVMYTICGVREDRVSHLLVDVVACSDWGTMRFFV